MGSKSLVIIERESQASRLISLAQTPPGLDTQLVFIALNKNVAQELSARGIQFKTPEDYGLSDEYLEEEGLKWLRTFPNIMVKDDKNIKELLVYKDLSVWWFLDETFYVSTYASYSTRQSIKGVIIIDRITETESPYAVYYVKNGTPASRAIELVCKSKNVAKVGFSTSLNKKRFLSQRIRKVIYQYGPLLQMLIRKIYWEILGWNYRRTTVSKRKRILTFLGEQWVNVYDPATGKTRKGDLYFDTIFDLLKDDYDIVSVGTPTSNWGLGVMKEKVRQERVLYRPFEHYWNLKVILRAIKASRELHRKYRILADCETFRQSLNRHDIYLYDLLEERLSLFFSIAYLTKVVATVEMARGMVESESPDAVLIGDSPIPERAIIAAAKSKNTPTIAITHGAAMITDSNFAHVPGDTSSDRNVTVPYCPIPDKFFANGEYDRDFMVKRARFPAENVIIGIPRYDILARADKLFSKKDIFDRLNLDPSKKLICWITQSHAFTPPENENNINIVYNALKKFKDVQLVIKLHPGEDQRATLYKEDKTFKPTVIGGGGAITFELLYASDIIITHYCTTVMEALMLNKPVIIVNFTGVPISVPYVESGASIDVYEEETLVTAIKDILHNEEARQKLAELREKFISEGKYRPDGQASQRVVDSIKQMVAESKGLRA